jgi:hypothetical protein
VVRRHLVALAPFSWRRTRGAAGTAIRTERLIATSKYDAVLQETRAGWQPDRGRSVASPDGKRAVTASDGGTAQLRVLMGLEPVDDGDRSGAGDEEQYREVRFLI